MRADGGGTEDQVRDPGAAHKPLRGRRAQQAPQRWCRGRSHHPGTFRQAGDLDPELVVFYTEPQIRNSVLTLQF